MTAVLLSIDTEFTARAHRPGADWRDNYARSIDAAGVGVAYQLDVLARHGLKACFFVDPMPALVFGDAPIRAIVEPILAAGQEVQLHLHPMWIDFAGHDDGPKRHDLKDYDADAQRVLIERARDLLMRAGAPAPAAFRAGAFAADRATFGALAAAGIGIDSSHNGSMLPRPCATGLPAHAVAPFAVDGIVELPVGLIAERGRRLRHLQIGAVSVAELRAALRHAEAEGNPLVTIVGHSFELATRDGRRVNRIVRRRFDALCAWLGVRGDRFPTVFAADCAELPLDARGTPCPHAPLRRASRVAMQGLSNLWYERRL